MRSVGLVKQKLSAAAIWGHKREGQNLEGDMIADCQGLGFRVYGLGFRHQKRVILLKPMLLLGRSGNNS